MKWALCRFDKQKQKVTTIVQKAMPVILTQRVLILIRSIHVPADQAFKEMDLIALVSFILCFP